jgi:hypothetical protein
MGATAVAVAVQAAERRVIRRLHDAGARSPATAQPLPETRLLEARRLEHLKEAGAIREAAPGLYYVDDEAYAAHRGDRRAVAIGVAITALGFVLLLTLLAGRG